MMAKGKKYDEMKELLQRTQANFENYQKQAEKRIKVISEMAARDIILQVLPLLDNFELALKNSANAEEFKKGVELIYAQFNALLENNQVKAMDTQDKMFDPHQHEALMKIASDKPENTIIEEFQRGYILHDQVIRHAKVKVSAGSQQEGKSENNPTENNTNGGQ